LRLPEYTYGRLGTEYRTALYHYLTCPGPSLFGPFYLLSQLVLGWFDERFVYLLLFAATLAMAYGLARRPRRQAGGSDAAGP